MIEAIEQALDELDDAKLEEALSDFLVEQRLVGEFLAWLEKWKSLHRVAEQNNDRKEEDNARRV